MRAKIWKSALVLVVLVGMGLGTWALFGGSEAVAEGDPPQCICKACSIYLGPGTCQSQCCQNTCGQPCGPLFPWEDCEGGWEGCQ